MNKNILRKIKRIKEYLNRDIDSLTYIQTYKYMGYLEEAVFYEIISEDDMKLKLHEMSNKWGVIERQMNSCLRIRWEHLIKMFYYKDFKQVHNEWIKSCRKGLEEISTLEKTHKLPSFEKLYNSTWIQEEEKFKSVHDDIVEMVNNKYDKLPPIIKTDYEAVKDFVQKYTEWSCRELSKKGCITHKEAFQKIYELLGLEI